MWERAGRLQDACDGSYFNGLPLFAGGGIKFQNIEIVLCLLPFDLPLELMGLP